MLDHDDLAKVKFFLDHQQMMTPPERLLPYAVEAEQAMSRIIERLSNL